MYSQNFGFFSNIENLFNLTKQEVEKEIKNNGYQFKEKDKSGITTYIKRTSGYTFSATTIFKGNQLKYFSWNDTLMGGSFIVNDIGKDLSYKIDETKSDDYLGVYTSVSDEKGLQVLIGKTIPNTNKGMIAFSLTKIGNKKIKNKLQIENTKESSQNDKISELINIEIEDGETFKKLVEQQKNKIFDYLKNSKENTLSYDLNIPTFEKMVEEKLNDYSFNNVYNIYYKKEDHSRPTQTNGYVVYAGSHDVKQINKFVNIEGNDKNFELLKKNVVYIPTYKTDDKEIMSEININNVDVEYQKGYLIGKIKKKQLTVSSLIPNKEVENKIKIELQNQNNGNYLIKYYYINVMGKEDVNVSVEKIKKESPLLKTSLSLMKLLMLG